MLYLTPTRAATLDGLLANAADVATAIQQGTTGSAAPILEYVTQAREMLQAEMNRGDALAAFNQDSPGMGALRANVKRWVDGPVAAVRAELGVAGSLRSQGDCTADLVAAAVIRLVYPDDAAPVDPGVPIGGAGERRGLPPTVCHKPSASSPLKRSPRKAPPMPDDPKQPAPATPAADGEPDELERLAIRATPGHWLPGLVDRYRRPHGYVGRVKVLTACGCKTIADLLSKPDKHFIAAANPARILALIAEHRRVVAERDALRRAVERITDETPGTVEINGVPENCAQCEEILRLARLALVAPPAREAPGERGDTTGAPKG